MTVVKLDAVEARRRTLRTKKSRERKEARERLIEVMKEKDRIKKRLREDYPKFVAKIRRQIAKAVQDGEDRIDSEDEESFILDKAYQFFQAEGFIVSYGYSPEHNEDMGDFNAPCNITVPAKHWLKIHW